MIYSANLIAILIPFVLLQYGFALFCLVKLVFLDLPKSKFFLWNFFILLVVGVGIITFLVCYFGFRDKVFPKKPEPERCETSEEMSADSPEPLETSEQIVSGETNTQETSAQEPSAEPEQSPSDPQEKSDLQ